MTSKRPQRSDQIDSEDAVPKETAESQSIRGYESALRNPRDPSPTGDLMEAFFQTARLNANDPAIIYNGRLLTYGEVAVRVRQVASQLGPDCGVIGVLTSRSPETIVALLGVLAAGGTYCPIDPTLPSERQSMLIRVSGCKSVIATETVRSAPMDVPTINLEADDPHTPELDLAAIDSSKPAYTLFTSGSTGEPKAVAVPRQAISTSVQSLRDLLEITSSDRVLQFASLSWDTCFEEILPAMTAGASVVIDDEAHLRSIPRLTRMIALRSVTILDLPTAYWHELVNYLTEAQTALPDCVRIVIIGGEAARPARLAEWCALATGRIRLINTYGCTETVLVTHAAELRGPRAAQPEIEWKHANSVPIGERLSHVLEHIDEAGELHIGGVSLALGYVALPQATADRFVTLSNGGISQRYFRTGDRVMRTFDRGLIHQGRLDNQIKVLGVRVDPGEVESAILRYRDAAAAAVTGALIANRMTMVAYVVARTSVDTGTFGRELMRYLRDGFPPYLVPTHVVVVPELLYTGSGKVDRARSHQRYSSQLNVREFPP